MNYKICCNEINLSDPKIETLYHQYITAALAGNSQKMVAAEAVRRSFEAADLAMVELAKRGMI